MLVFKNISSATASRDLKCVVDNQPVEKFGDKRMTRYKKAVSKKNGVDSD